MVLKPLKIRPPWYVFFDYFTTRPSFKNLYDTLLIQWPEMLKCAEKELKLKMSQIEQFFMFLISALYSLFLPIRRTCHVRFCQYIFISKWKMSLAPVYNYTYWTPVHTGDWVPPPQKKEENSEKCNAPTR